MQVAIILVEPARPENVGAAARAMKTMGFSQLRIVGSDAHRKPAARWLAHGATDILKHCQHYASLQHALSDVQLTIASTARRRGKFRYYYSAQQLLPILEEKRQWLHQAALVFGRESSGLTNEELGFADILTSIPLQADYPSLNLAQAVMVYCYQLSSLIASPSMSSPSMSPSVIAAASALASPLSQAASLPPAALTSPPAATAFPLQALRERLSALLHRLNVSDDEKLADWLAQRLGLLEQRDVAMLHRLLRDIENNITATDSSPCNAD